jgi:tellurite resistance protein
MLLHSSFSDFVLFLFVHLSNADSSYDPKELAAIKDKMKGLFPDSVDFEKKLYQTIREYNSLDKSNLDDLLQASAEHFRKEKPSPEVLEAFQDIISADGKIDPEETKALDTLKQIIGA